MSPLKGTKKHKGWMKRFQESIELMDWKYENVDVNKEIESSVSFLCDGDDSMDIEYPKVPWTDRDKRYIEKKCKNKAPLLTFLNKQAVSKTPALKIWTRKEVKVALNCSLLELQGNKMYPNFRTDDPAFREILFCTTKKFKSNGQVIPNKTMLPY